MMTSTKTKAPKMTWSAGLALIYGAVCYLIFLFTLVYSISFLGDFIMPKSLDSGQVAPPLQAVLVDVALLGLFALQHSIMARPAFKRWWGHFVPRPIERSTYVLFASLALLLIYWQWLPLPTTIWNLTSSGVRYLVFAAYGAGWLIVVGSSFLIDHADLFGLRQVYIYWQGRDEHTPVFKIPALYRLVRHPMMMGFLLVFWATPRMSVGRLLFSLAMTGYIVAGIHFEERDLLAYYGAIYQRYRRQVRMLIPFPKRWSSPPERA